LAVALLLDDEDEVEQDDDLSEGPAGGVGTDQHGEFDDAPAAGGVSTQQHGEFDDAPHVDKVVEGPGGGIGTDQHGQFDDGANQADDGKAADDSFVGEGEPKRTRE